MASASDGSRIFELLRELGREYENEVGRLTNEIDGLRAQLFLAGVPPSSQRSTALHALKSEAESVADDTPAEVRARDAGNSTDDLHAGVKMKAAWTIREADYMALKSVTPVASQSAPRTSRRRSRTSLTVLDGRRSCIPFSPTSNWRTFWDIAGLLMVIWDMIVVPLSVYDRPDSVAIDVIDKVILVFWTLDLLMSFFIGYWSAGELVMEIRRIVPHYLKTWFIFDLIVVGPDWIVLMIGSGEISYSRLLRGTRFVRVLRLLRIMKLQRILNKLYDLINNEDTFIAAELIKMLSFIVVLNHIIACGWWLMGKLAASDGFKNWISFAQDYNDEHWAYQYATCLHWSLTQFTPASMDVVARNMYERVYSIFVLFFAIVAFSSIVGTVTASMTVLRGMKNDKEKSFWSLRRYLKQEHISSGLQRRLLKFVNHQVAKQETRVQRANVRVLTHISTQLSAELAHEMYSPLLCNQPFLNHICKEFETVGFRLCHSALRPVSLAGGDVLFSVGEAATLAYIVKVGDFHYRCEHTSMLVSKGELLAEAVLWASKWRYCGTSVAQSPCELLSVVERDFVETLCAHEVPWMFAKSYGERFVAYLNSPQYDETDLIRDERFFEESVDYAKQVILTQSTMFGNTASVPRNGAAVSAEATDALPGRYMFSRQSDFGNDVQETECRSAQGGDTFLAI